ncbi:HEAT repeat domain-containing protein [Myxococcota bacterium]|nr:HEAT repeat domain-containing protein [Myxococcota bacterium]
MESQTEMFFGEIVLWRRERVVRGFLQQGVAWCVCVWLVLWGWLGISEAGGDPSWKALVRSYQAASTVSAKVEYLDAIGRLGHKGKSAIPTLLGALKDGSSVIRRAALLALGDVGAKEIGPHLSWVRAASLESHWRVRMAAVQVLFQAAQHERGFAKCFPWLVSLVHDTRPEVRVAAVEALGRLGVRARSALPTLLHALRDPHTSVHQEAIVAIRPMFPRSVKASPQTDALIGRLRDLLKSKDYLTRTLVAKTLAGWGGMLAGLGDVVEPLVGDLGAALADLELPVRMAAGHTLAQIGERSLVVLQKALRDPRREVRLAAIKALEERAQHPAFFAILRKALEDKDLLVQEAAILAVGSAEQSGASAVDALIPYLNAPQAALRQGAIWTLSRIGKAAVPALRKAALLDSWWWRVAAIDALGAIGPAAAPAALGLLQGLHHTQWQVRRSAAFAIPTIGRDLLRYWPAKHAISELIRALLDGQWQVRYGAIAALRWYGPQAVAAIPALQKQLTAHEPIIRQAAERALRVIQSSSGKMPVPSMPRKNKRL